MNVEKPIALDSGKSGRDHSETTYLDALERQAEWLRRGAGQKADSVEQLLRRNRIKPESVLELGCGTGAVIGELQRRGLAQHYYGIDYSATAITYLKTAFPNIQCAVADVMETANVFDEDSFDVVICSHIIEHLEDPVLFLQAIGRQFQFDYLVAEVPLEDLFFGRVKALLNDRSKNPAGHVQFFTRRSFLALFTAIQSTIVDERVYAPSFGKETLQFAYGEKGLLRYLGKMLTEHYLPKHASRLWTRWYHAHYAVLCKKR
ncbi:MAG: class I SAM-dependent methyltransferase [Bacteroidetes bacterium]|nr:class I SAM-dependent methyltransferase [Bacteroidota bacterium]MDE2670955.1 class I SAM-dependent methyltransferase [Bacteroidota bacterium]